MSSSSTSGVEGRGDSSAIDGAAARRLFVARYQQLFGDKYFLNPVDGKYTRFPEIEPDSIDSLERTPGAWSIKATPPAGVSVVGRVDLQGRWVDIESVSFASE
jgi:hypothetical protein